MLLFQPSFNFILLGLTAWHVNMNHLGCTMESEIGLLSWVSAIWCALLPRNPLLLTSRRVLSGASITRVIGISGVHQSRRHPFHRLARSVGPPLGCESVGRKAPHSHLLLAGRQPGGRDHIGIDASGAASCKPRRDLYGLLRHSSDHGSEVRRGKHREKREQAPVAEAPLGAQIG